MACVSPRPWAKAAAAQCSRPEAGPAKVRPSEVRPSEVHPAQRYLRQNAGVNSTSAVNSSTRPRNIAAVHTQVWKSVSAA